VAILTTEFRMQKIKNSTLINEMFVLGELKIKMNLGSHQKQVSFNKKIFVETQTLAAETIIDSVQSIFYNEWILSLCQ